MSGGERPVAPEHASLRLGKPIPAGPKARDGTLPTGHAHGERPSHSGCGTVRNAPGRAICPLRPDHRLSPVARLPAALEQRPHRDRAACRLPPAAWTGRHDADCRKLLDVMHTRADRLASIPRDFDVAKLPEPVWRGMPCAPFDAAALHTLIGATKPRLYLETGSGVTTTFAPHHPQSWPTTRIVSIDLEPRHDRRHLRRDGSHQARDLHPPGLRCAGTLATSCSSTTRTTSS